MRQTNPRISKALESIHSIETHGKAYTCKGYYNSNIAVRHIQGIAAFKHFQIMTHSADKGTMIVFEKVTGKDEFERLYQFELDENKIGYKGQGHPGGIQIVGDLCIVPDGSSNVSNILFFDLTNLSNKDTKNDHIELMNFQINTYDRNYGAIGATDLQYQGREVLLLAAFTDKGQADFLTVEGYFDKPDSLFYKRLFTWQFPKKVAGEANYNGIGLFTTTDNKVLFLGFRTQGDKDYLDYYQVDIENKQVSVPANNEVHMYTKKGGASVNVHFRWAGSLNVLENNVLKVEASQRNSIAHSANINVFSPAESE